MRFKKKKNPHTVHYCCSAFLKCIDFYKAPRSEKQGVLWLASYPVRCDWPNTSCETEMLRPLPSCDAVSQRDDTKTIKPIINEAFVAFSEDLITDYNYVYCLFTHCVAPRKHYNVCICDRRNTKQQALLYTAQNSCFNSQWQIL